MLNPCPRAAAQPQRLRGSRPGGPVPSLRSISRYVIAALTLLFFTFRAAAQVTNVTADQTPPIAGVGHDYIQLLNETVNPATGSVSVRIGVPVPPGRGVTVPFAFTYDSNSAHHLLFPAWGDNVAYLGRGGWTYLLPRLVNQTHQITWQQPPSAPYSCTFNNSFVFNDLQGRSHSLGMAIFQVATPPPGGCTYPLNAPSSISSGGDDYVQSTATTTGSVGYPSYTFPVTVADEDGTVYYFSGSHQHAPPGAGGLENLPDWIETRNGNRITYVDSTNNNGVFSVTDTLGRTLLASSGFGTSGNTLTVAGLSNPSYTLTWGTATYNTSYAFTISNASGLNYSCIQPTQNSATSPVITAIALPNGKTYQFQYDPASGLLSKIIYPNGGYVRYVWGPNHSSDVREFLPDTNHNFTCAMIYDTPAVQSRYVSFDGNTEVQRQDFTYSTAWVSDNQCNSSNCQKWTVKTTTVTTHDLLLGTSFETDYSYAPTGVAVSPDSAPFVVSNGALQWGSIQTQFFPVEQAVTYKSTTGSILKTVTKSWINQYLLDCELQTLDNNMIAGTFYTYGPGGVMTDKKEYDFGQITSASACQAGAAAPPSPFRETVITPQTFAATPIYPGHVSIFDRPASVVVKNSAGTTAAETDYLYDQSAVGPVSNLALGTHDETNYGTTTSPPRGNATTITRKCLQSCSDSTTKYTFDETGQVLTKVDACGIATCADMSGSNHTTTYSYTNSFDSNPSSNANAYVYQITDALGHLSTFKYAYADGQLISSTDSNNKTTSYSYEPSLRRLSETDFPDGGYTKICYTDAGGNICSQGSYPYKVITRKAINDSTYAETTTVMDGTGHTTQTQTADAIQGTIYTDTTYDGLGRVRTQSNPYRSGMDATSSPGTTTFAYDALGRKLTATAPDNSVINTSYCGPSTLVKDPTNRWRRSRSDGLGRLVEVDEPNSSSASVNVCPGTGEPIWVTGYGYDILGNLMSVVQNGSHNRSFAYDSLSRLLTSTNPEVGTITYTYDANSNVSTKKDARNITTTYGYDVLNREKSRTYSNGDPSVSVNYDEANCLGFSPCQNIGHQTSMTDAAGSESWAYQVNNAGDSNKRTVHVNQRTITGQTKTSTYYLDLAGNTTQLVYPSGRVVNYSYDNANRPSKATDAVNGLTYATGFQTTPTNTACVATAVCYTPQGTPYATSVGQSSTFTGLNITESFNSRLQPNQIKASSTGGNAMDITYAYTDPVVGGNAGHVFSIANNLDTTRSQTFSYDQVNRIISAQASTYAASPAHCWGETYTLDPWANLQSITPNPAYSGCSQEAGFSQTASTSNRLSGFQYDASGNTTNDGVFGYQWNAESQLNWLYNVTYTYDGNGRRVSKTGGTEPKLYWYGSGGEILTETNPSALEIVDYVYFNGRRVAQLANDVNLNGGFEGGLTNWTAAGGGTVTAVANAANAHSGSQYALITSPASQNTTVTTSQPISAQKGETVTMTGWVYLESGSSGYVRWWVFVNGNAGQCRLDGSGGNDTIPNTWVYQTASVTIPTWCNGPYTVTVYAEIQAGSQAISARFDDVSLNGNTLLFAEDSLGTTRVITDTSGVVCYDADFYPYGGERPYTNTCTTHYKFEGKERDAETNNDYFGARFYTNRFGRWLSSDWSAVPIAVPYANLTNPQTLNLYSMVADDPESFADLDGHCTNGPVDPCPQGQSQNAESTQQQSQTADQGWSLSWQAKASANFLGEEVKGVWDATGGGLIDMGKSIVSGEAEKNIATTAKWAVTSPGKIGEALKEAGHEAIQTVQEAASGNPRAIGQVVGTGATIAYAATNVEVTAYKNTGGGGINILNTPTTNSRIGIDFHGKFKGSGGPKPHIDITIKKPGVPSGAGSNLINVKHWPW